MLTLYITFMVINFFSLIGVTIANHFTRLSLGLEEEEYDFKDLSMYLLIIALGPLCLVAVALVACTSIGVEDLTLRASVRGYLTRTFSLKS